MSVLAALFMAIDVEVFHALRRFLNTSLLSQAGGVRLELSVAEHVTPHAVAYLFILPCLVLATHLLSLYLFGGGLMRLTATVMRPWVLPTLVAILFGSSYIAQNRWFTEENHEFADSPHLIFLRSWLWGVGYQTPIEPEPAEFAEFLPGQSWTPLGYPGARPKNLVVIVLESVSANYLNVYGGRFETLPQLAALTDRAVVFDNIYAPATHSAASALALFGSAYNDPHLTATISDRPGFPVSSGAQWLRRKGFRTYFIGGGDWNHLNMGSALLGDGFDLARDWFRHWSETRRSWLLLGRDHSDSRIFADAVRCLDEVDGKPFYMMLWTYDTHVPYKGEAGSEPFDELLFPAVLARPADHRLSSSQATGPQKRREFQNYLQSVRRADRLIGEFYRELKRRNLADSTLLVVVGDHGEAFGQHGWFYHGHALYEEDVHVPLIMIHPALLQLQLQRQSQMVGSVVDLWPTISDILGYAPHPQWQGVSLLAYERANRAYFYRSGALGVRDGKYKYFWDYYAGRQYLFDLEADPGERHNLASDMPVLAGRLRRRVRVWEHFQRNATDKLMNDLARGPALPASARQAQ
jgi:arylsulfatase A-like enzyme